MYCNIMYVPNNNPHPDAMEDMPTVMLNTKILSSSPVITPWNPAVEYKNPINIRKIEIMQKNVMIAPFPNAASGCSIRF